MGQLIISVPLFFIFSVIQSVAISRIEIIAGTGDIVLLAIIAWTIIDEDGNYLGWGIIAGFLISILSSLPLAATFAIYLGCALTAKIATRIFWQSPILSLFSSVLISSIIKFFIEMITLQYMGIAVPFFLSVTSILFPTIVINLFLTFPVYVLMGDISRWISPKDEIYA
jgi:cell shape-determining protein MreD